MKADLKSSSSAGGRQAIPMPRSTSTHPTPTRAPGARARVDRPTTDDLCELVKHFPIPFHSPGSITSTLLAVAFSIALLARPDPCFALDPARDITQYVHQKWSDRNGMPSAVIRAIEQTRDGYLWVGTPEGLLRFDGVQFTAFDTSTTPRLTNNDVRDLLETRDGSLWIATYGGGVLRFEDGKLTTYSTADGLAHDVVYSLFEDREGVLWIGTAAGLSRLQDREINSYGTREGLGSERVFPILQGDRGDLWIGTFAGGVIHFADGRFRTHASAAELGSDIVFSLYRDGEGALWVGTYGGGLTRSKDGELTRYTTASGLSDNRITKILQDRDGNLWIGTYGGGINRLGDGGVFEAFAEEHGLSGNVVQELFEDDEGALWIGTSRGLDRLKDGVFTSFSTQEGLSHDFAYSIYEDRAGAIWIGTEGGGVNRIDGRGIHAYTAADGLASNNVISVLGGGEGSLWLGTFGAGLARFANGRFTSMSTADGLAGNLVFALAEGRGGALWVGTFDGGLNRLLGTHLTTYEGLGKSGIRGLHSSRDGTLWIGTNGDGLVRFAEGRFTAYTTADGLGSNIVQAIYQDRSGTLWIGTKEGGLSRSFEGRFFTYGKSHGLADNTINSILEDDAGFLWLCGPKGVVRVEKRRLEEVAQGEAAILSAFVFGRADGIQSGQCNGGSQPGALKARDGRLWFPTSEGVVVVDPSRPLIDATPPRLHIERVVVGDRPLPLAASVRLPAGARNIEIGYTGLSFSAGDLIRFRYRLEGFDSEWTNVGSRRAAYYTNLDPGDYRFVVTAANRAGIWNDVPAAISFTVEPFFYETWWFLLISGAGATLLLIGGYRSHVRRLREREVRLQRLVAERTSELEEARDRLERLSKTDPLTGIANRRGFDEVLGAEWRRAARRGLPLSMIMVDIDSFKAFNDAYGHLAGDRCLERVASVLRSEMRRPGDLVGRYGGEEFIILAPGIDAGGAIAAAERLRVAVESLAIPHQRSEIADVVTVSAGVATAVPAEGRDPGDLVAMSDAALYSAKQSGKNTTRMAGGGGTVEYDPDQNDAERHESHHQGAGEHDTQQHHHQEDPDAPRPGPAR